MPHRIIELSGACDHLKILQICEAVQLCSSVGTVKCNLEKSWRAVLDPHGMTKCNLTHAWTSVAVICRQNAQESEAPRECHARSAHAVRSFECRQILEPYFWPLFTSFSFRTRVFLASQAFRMWHQNLGRLQGDSRT